MKVSRFLVAYICLLLSSSNGMKAPKNINSNDYEKVIKGCKNQAMDIKYLNVLSIDRIPDDNMEIIFASEDKMLREIFKFGYLNIDPLKLYLDNISKNSRKMSEWIEELINDHVEFVCEDYRGYCKRIIKEESENLQNLIK